MDDATTLNDLVASEIRAWLGRRRMTGRQLAAKLGKSQTWMATRLRGETEIGLNDLGLIANGLDVDITDLFPVPAERERRSGQRTTGNSSTSTDRPTAERLMAAQIHPDHHLHQPAHPEPQPAEIRTGTRRPRIQPWSHGGVTAR